MMVDWLSEESVSVELDTLLDRFLLLIIWLVSLLLLAPTLSFLLTGVLTGALGAWACRAA